MRRYACLFQRLLEAIRADGAGGADLKAWGREWTQTLLEGMRTEAQAMNEALGVDEKLKVRSITVSTANGMASTDDVINSLGRDIDDTYDAIKITFECDDRVNINTVYPVPSSNGRKFALKSASIDGREHTCDNQECFVALPDPRTTRGAVLYYVAV
jgi:hypothetical protein